VLLVLSLAVVDPLGPAAADEGYSRVRVEEAGISLLVPKRWDADLWTRESARRAIAQDPKYRGRNVTVEQLLAMPLFANWDSDADGVPDHSMTVSVVSGAKSWLSAPEEVARVMANGYGVEDVQVERTKINGKPALVATSSLTTYAVDGPIVSNATRYLFANRDGDVISVSFVRPQDDDTAFDGMVDTVIDSVSLLPGTGSEGRRVALAGGGVATGPTSQEMCAPGQTPALAAYERRTGAYQWSTCTPVADERRDVVDATSDAVSLRTIDYSNSGPRTITVVDARTGATRSTSADPSVGETRPTLCVDGVCISGGQDDPMVATDAKTQKVLWTQPDAHPVYDDIWAVGDGAVYAIHSPRGAAPTLAAYEIRTGRTRWRRSVAPYTDAAPWLVRNGVLFSIWNNLTLVSTADGSVLWHTAFPMAEFPRVTGVRANADQVFVAFSPIASDGD
jgi:outer membrane protein assembly factor BamB